MHDWDSGKDVYSQGDESTPGFIDFLPSSTSGKGTYKKNNLKTGSKQGRGTLKRKAECQQCGFILDASRDSHDGGSLSGDGAGGAVTTGTSTFTYVNTGAILSEVWGNQAHAIGGGCPLCFSKNSIRESQRLVDNNVAGTRQTGF